MEAHESLQKLNRLYFAYVHQSTSVTTTTAGRRLTLHSTNRIYLYLLYFAIVVPPHSIQSKFSSD